MSQPKFLIVLLLSFSLLTLAKPSTSYGREGRKTFSGKKIVNPENIVSSDSSEANRQDKSFYVLAQVISLAPLAAMGLQGGYFLNPDSVLMLATETAKFEFLGFSTTTTTTSLSYKKFHGNSFYWRGGLGMRTVKYEDDFSSFISSSATTYKFSGTATSLGIDFGIGNHWQWDAYSMGCDWIGFFAPISSSSSASASGTYSEEAFARDKKDMENVSKRGHPQLLKFYLGVAF